MKSLILLACVTQTPTPTAGDVCLQKFQTCMGCSISHDSTDFYPGATCENMLGITQKECKDKVDKCLEKIKGK